MTNMMTQKNRQHSFGGGYIISLDSVAVVLGLENKQVTP